MMHRWIRMVLGTEDADKVNAPVARSMPSSLAGSSSGGARGGAGSSSGAAAASSSAAATRKTAAGEVRSVFAVEQKHVRFPRMART